MTWQRIDEDTYIDDSLVTCAEYQLFIDEMREQGKYHQPDHWTSFRFPEGQAREPILGARYFDAIAFCEWVTKQQSNSWKYRLPTQKETTEFFVTSFRVFPVGFWINRRNKFIWIGKIPKDARGINWDFDFDLEKACERSRSRPLDLTRALSYARAFHIENTFNLIHVVDRSDFSERNMYLPQFLALKPDIIQIISNTASHNQDFKPWRVIDIYYDLFTLRERMAGRSPAFEGIRLVKERIK